MPRLETTVTCVILGSFASLKLEIFTGLLSGISDLFEDLEDVDLGAGEDVVVVVGGDVAALGELQGCDSIDILGTSPNLSPIMYGVWRHVAP